MVDEAKTAIEEPTLHPGVELIVARMRSNPEEFKVGMNGRWTHILKTYEPYFTTEEQDAMSAAIRDIRMEQFHHAAMNELLRETAPDVVPTPYLNPNSTIPLGLANAANTYPYSTIMGSAQSSLFRRLFGS